MKIIYTYLYIYLLTCVVRKPLYTVTININNTYINTFKYISPFPVEILHNAYRNRPKVIVLFSGDSGQCVNSPMRECVNLMPEITHDDVIRWKHFRVTGHLCREFTGRRWIPCTKVSDAELWCFLWINAWVYNREAGDLRRHCAHYDVIVMDLCNWFIHCSLGAKHRYQLWLLMGCVIRYLSVLLHKDTVLNVKKKCWTI